MKKIIGILGGMGPMATSKLFEMLIEMTIANSDNENAHIIIDNNTDIPDRTDYILHGGESPLIELRKSQLRLEEAGADFIIMPCNTAHYFYDELKDSSKVEIMHMPKLAIEELKREYKGKTVGLLATAGTINTKIYENLFKSEEIDFIIPNTKEQKLLMNFIYAIKANEYKEHLEGFLSVLEGMKKKGVEVFLVGCTELSVAVKLFDLRAFNEILDAMELLAKKALTEAGYSIRK